MLQISIRLLIFLIGIAINAESHAEISTVELVAKIRPSIVSISVAPSSATLLNQTSKDLRSPSINFNARNYGVGSGTIISSDGYILTTDGILNSAGEITVTLDDGSKTLAKLIGKDTKSGFALIKIQKANLAFINVIYPHPIALGQNLISIGRTALGSISIPVVTNGIISAVTEGNNRNGAIQSTIPVQPGMGGAPVLSLNTGEIIGIIQMIYRSDDFSPITFSTPIDEYLKVENALKSNSLSKE